MDIYSRMKEMGMCRKSALNEKIFRKFIKDIPMKVAVEIGTYKGATAAFIANQVDHVYTFDIDDHADKYPMWEELGLNDKITFVQNKTTDDVKKILDGIDFDFCFIDGPSNEDLEHFFEMTKKCGKVLFHNTKKTAKFIDKYNHVKQLTNGNVIRIGRHSLYWEE